MSFCTVLNNASLDVALLNQGIALASAFAAYLGQRFLIESCSALNRFLALHLSHHLGLIVSVPLTNLGQYWCF